MASPRGLSLSQQWLLIAVVTLVPMLALVSYASWSFFQQMTIQRLLAERTDVLDNRQSSLNARILDLERFARQFRLLRDPTFLDPYRTKREEVFSDLEHLERFVQNEKRIAGALVAESQQQRLNEGLQEVRHRLNRLNEETIVSLAEAEFSGQLSELSQQRSALNSAGDDYAQALSSHGEQRLQRILWRLSLLTLFSLPIILTIMILGFWQMIRPIRGLEIAIRHLGHGDWDTPISVNGPTDFQELGHQLEWLRGQLRVADQQKQTFLRHVSHELKTPLSAIVEAGALLQDEVPGPVNKQQQSVLRILLNNSHNLQELIQQLLNYNVITHNVSLEIQPVAIESLCRKITDRLDQQNLRHRVNWDCRGDPESLPGDAQLLEMIVSNLLSNAYHYSPVDGMVQVRWGIKHHEAWLSVTDQGPGIEPVDREKIFQPFVQGKVRRHGSVYGSGVGLAIVKESVSRLGGEIRVESHSGEGSCFLLRYPLSQATLNHAVSEESSL